MTDATPIEPQETPTADIQADDGHTAPEAKGLPKRLRGTRDAQDAVPAEAVGRTVPARLASALEHAKICARIASDNRAKEVVLLDLRKVTSLVDYFMIASASSRRQAAAIVYEIDAEMKKLGELKLGMEGADEGRWALIDYGDFVVHLFSEEARAYYSLDDIWGDAPKIDWREGADAVAEPKGESA